MNNIDSKYLFAFFDGFYYLLEMCYTLYPRKHHSIFSIRALYKKINEHYYSSKCEHCNVIYQHSINRVKLILCLFEDQI